MILDRLIDLARHKRRRLVMPEATDERVLAAARRLRDEGIAEPILPTDIESDPRLDAYAALYPGNARVAARAVRKPLFHAAMIVKAGDADAMVAHSARSETRVA